MRVFVAGATGAVGRPLVRLLRQAGHEVVGTTRSEARAAELRELGAEPVVCDALDANAVRAAVLDARPEAIVNQLTNLSRPFNPRKYAEWLRPTNELRRRGTRALAAAGVEAGARRLVSQSIAFFYEWSGDGPKAEDDPLISEPPGGLDDAVDALNVLERTTLETAGLEGIVLRYGYFYGPDTSFAPGGNQAEEVRKRRFPIVGAGTGRFSFIHVDDAAAAAVAALERGRPGVYNVVDDEPAAMRDWLPVYAEALGAKPPWRVPLWLARLFAGRAVTDAAVEMRGASNEKAKRELGWQPRWSSWREGFREALG